MNKTDALAMTQFDSKKHLLVAVVGEGKAQHLETRQLGLFGRFFRWLGLLYRNTTPEKVATYVNERMKSWAKEDVPAASKLMEKLQHYHQNHPKRSLPLFERPSPGFQCLA